MLNEEIYLFYIKRGDHYFRQSNLDNAVNCYKKAAVLDPQNIIPHLRMGDVNKLKGDLDASLLNYRKAEALARSPKSTIYRKMGNIYFEKGQYEKAHVHYAKAIELKPGRALNYQLLANVYFEQGRLLQALSNYTKAITLDNKNLLAYERRSKIYFSQDELDLGLSDCNKAIALNPKKIKLYFIRATFYCVLNNYAAAFRDCNKVLEQEPKNIDAYALLGFLCLKGARYIDAIRGFGKVIELDASAKAYFYRAEAYEKAGCLTPALCDFHSAHMLEPKNEKYQIAFENFLKAHSKSQIYNLIKHSPEEKYFDLLDQTLKPETCLGGYFKIKKYVPVLKFFPSVKRMNQIKESHTTIHAKRQELNAALEVEKRKAYQAARIIAQGCRNEIGQEPSQFAFFRNMPLEIAVKIASMATNKLSVEEVQKIILDHSHRPSVGKSK